MKQLHGESNNSVSAKAFEIDLLLLNVSARSTNTGMARLALRAMFNAVKGLGALALLPLREALVRAGSRATDRHHSAAPKGRQEPNAPNGTFRSTRLIAEDGEARCPAGLIPEADLVAFYSVCDVFFFPSLYEGLGLPVLEAMACGAPVICGDNSSLRELVQRSDAVFDANKTASIAERVAKVLNDRGFADELRRHGIDRAKGFSWKSTATRAFQAFDEALARKRTDGKRAATSGWLPKPRLAMLTPLPPSRSGIADYNTRFLPFLAEHFEIDIYVDGYAGSDLQLNSAFRIFSVADFRGCAGSYDATLYELGNSEFHVHMLALLEEFPGVVGLHDAYVSGLMGYLEFNLGEVGRYSREMLHAHGGQARRLFAPVQANPNANGVAMINLPCGASHPSG